MEDFDPNKPEFGLHWTTWIQLGLILALIVFVVSLAADLLAMEIAKHYIEAQLRDQLRSIFG